MIDLKKEVGRIELAGFKSEDSYLELHNGRQQISRPHRIRPQGQQQVIEAVTACTNA
jgi:hypothetical protein